MSPDEFSQPLSYSPHREFSGGGAFFSGVIAREPEAAFAAQARDVMAQIEERLEAAGYGLGDVVKVTCYLTSAADFDSWNSIFAELMPQPFPARTTICCGLVLGDIEVEAIAARR